MDLGLFVTVLLVAFVLTRFTNDKQTDGEIARGQIEIANKLLKEVAVEFDASP